MQDAGFLKRMAEAARASRSELGLVVLLAVVVVGAGALVLIRTSDPPAPAIERLSPPPGSPTPSPSPSPALVVHVSGQVAQPGVYELSDGARVLDALQAAGGPLEESDAHALNLAAPVADGQKITVPKPGQPVPEGSGGAGAGTGPVNLNTASAAQLETLPGVGPVLAERIVAHRSKRRFTSTKQLMEVSGFGPKRYAALKDLITV